MMRRCIADKCTNNDSVILCHRFPKSRGLAKKWALALNLSDCPLDVLCSKYTVCSQHFESTDYRDATSNSLKATAIPKILANNPRAHTSTRTTTAPAVEATELSTATCTENSSSSPLNNSDSIELLNEEDITEIDESLVSNPRSSEELCILPSELSSTDPLVQSGDGSGFTMLDAAGCTIDMPPDSESPSEFALESKDSGDNIVRPSSSSDSDVDVLVSESMFDAHWSKTKRSDSTAPSTSRKTNTSRSNASPSISCTSNTSTLHDPEYNQLDRLQLIDIIKNQSAKIEQLEQVISTFKLAQEKLLKHFDVFRKRVCGVQI